MCPRLFYSGSAQGVSWQHARSMSLMLRSIARSVVCHVTNLNCVILHGQVLDVDPATGEVEGDEEGFPEEYPLEQLSIATADFMARVRGIIYVRAGPFGVSIAAGYPCSGVSIVFFHSPNTVSIR